MSEFRCTPFRHNATLCKGAGKWQNVNAEDKTYNGAPHNYRYTATAQSFLRYTPETFA